MGCRISKICGSPKPLQIVVIRDGSDTTTIQRREDLTSYQEACQTDADVRSFDASLQQRMSRAITSVYSDPVLESHALSFDSIRDVTLCLLDTNREVVKIILESEENIWNNRELFGLVQEYFDNSRQTMDFCVVLEKCLKRASDGVVIVRSALQCFQEEQEMELNVDVEEGERNYSRTLDELRSFKEADSPFDDEFFRALESVRIQQISMLEKLRRQKKRLDKKMKSVRSWRKVSSVIFVSAVAAILICSVVAAALAAPPVAAAVAAAASVPLGSMGKWVDSLWKGYEKVLKEQREFVTTLQLHTYEKVLKEQREFVTTLQLHTYCVKTDLDNIKVLVDNLQVHLESMLCGADFSLRGDDAVRFGVEEIRNRLDVFMKCIHDLNDQADRCIRDSQKARDVILRRIMQHSNGN